MKTLRLAGFCALFALAACDDRPTQPHVPNTDPDPTTNPDPTTDPGEAATVMYGQVVNGRTQPVPPAKVVLIWGYFGAMFPPFGDSVNLNGTFPEAFQLALPAPPPADRLFLPSGGFPTGTFDPSAESRIAIAQILIVRQEANIATWIPSADIIGGAEDFALVYAEHDVAAGTAGAAYLGGPVAAGYHLVKVATNAARDAVYDAISQCERQAADIPAWKACGIYTSLSVAAPDATVGVRLVDSATALNFRHLGPTFITPGAPAGPPTCIPPMDPNLMPCPT
jgi:hypothetical protein